MQSTCDKRYIRKPKTLWEFKERSINSCQEMREAIVEVEFEWCVKGIGGLEQNDKVMGRTAKAGELVSAKLHCMFGKCQIDWFWGEHVMQKQYKITLWPVLCGYQAKKYGLYGKGSGALLKLRACALQSYISHHR